jgi:hypothetical protein
MIEHPVEGQHLICFMGSERPLRRHVMLVVGGEHPTSYRCSRCAQANPEAVKLFSMRGIRPHVMYTCVSPRFTDIFHLLGLFFSKAFRRITWKRRVDRGGVDIGPIVPRVTLEKQASCQTEAGFMSQSAATRDENVRSRRSTGRDDEDRNSGRRCPIRTSISSYNRPTRSALKTVWTAQIHFAASFENRTKTGHSELRYQPEDQCRVLNRQGNSLGMSWARKSILEATLLHE